MSLQISNYKGKPLIPSKKRLNKYAKHVIDFAIRLQNFNLSNEV